MNPDENVEDPARKETQEFDPALVDEEGIHPEPAQDAEPTVLQQEQREKEVEEKPGHGGSWHTFKTP
jgi:hypothetical protein